MDKEKKKKAGEQDFLETINPRDAVEILKILYAQDVKVAKRIERAGNQYLSGVDLGQIAEKVYSSLDRLDIVELSGRSGSGPHGYEEPGNVACEMIEETLEPFWAEMKKYQKFSKTTEAKFYCMGILKGINRYEKESRSQVKDWAGDGVSEYFYWIYKEWEKGCRNPQERKEMKEFVEVNK